MTVAKLIQTLLEMTETYRLDPSKVEVRFFKEGSSNSDPAQEIVGMEFEDIPDPDQKNKIILVSA